MSAAIHRESFADDLREYIRSGLVLVPIPCGLKGPRRRGWNTRRNCWTAAAHVPDAYTGNIGVAHAYAGTCALDIDAADSAARAMARYGIDLAALVGARDAVHIHSGRAGRDKLLYHLPAGVPPLASINRNTAGEGFELRCATSSGLTVQDVLPPSIHPDTGNPYQWAGDWRALPELPAELLAQWRSLLRAPDVYKRPATVTRIRTRELTQGIPEGQRNNTLLSLAAGLVRQGYDARIVNSRLQRINADRCIPSLCATDVDTIASRACNYGSTGFYIVLHALDDSREWKALSPAARDVIRMAFRRYDGANNGNIALTEADFKCMCGFGSNNTLRDALAEALASEIILRVSEPRNTQGGRKPALYAIAAKWIRQVQNLHVAPSAESAHLHR